MRPEPPPEVGEAIVAALRTASAGSDESPWWRVGIDESLRDEFEAE